MHAKPSTDKTPSGSGYEAAQTANCSDASILDINVNVQIYGHSYRLTTTTVGKTTTVGEDDYGRE